MTTKPLVYIAGPISGAELDNTRAGVLIADRLRDGQYGDGGCVAPILPHLTSLWHLVSPAAYERWLAYDFDVLLHCHALFRMPGESPGADREVAFAMGQGIPVFRNVDQLEAWAMAGGWRR